MCDLCTICNGDLCCKHLVILGGYISVDGYCYIHIRRYLNSKSCIFANSLSQASCNYKILYIALISSSNLCDLWLLKDTNANRFWRKLDVLCDLVKGVQDYTLRGTKIVWIPVIFDLYKSSHNNRDSILKHCKRHHLLLVIQHPCQPLLLVISCLQC